MIRCKICGRWVSRLHSVKKELQHFDGHNINNEYDLLTFQKYFEVFKI